MEYGKRRRLPDYDYSKAGAYFVTICTKHREPLLGTIPPQPTDHVAQLSELRCFLSPYGQAVDVAINAIESHYPNVTVQKYIIMPNHIHMILLFHETAEDGRSSMSCATALPTVIKQMKWATTKSLGQSIWQTSFHDRIIRDEEEYQAVWRYIDENPLKWELDRYYMRTESAICYAL